MKPNHAKNLARAAAAAAVLGLCGTTRAAPPPPEPPAEVPARQDVTAALQPTAADAALRPLCIVLLDGPKDHGPEAHDYPLWQKRWALLLGGQAASQAGQANLHGPPLGDADALAGAEKVTVQRARDWPSEEQFATADVIVAYCYLKWTDERKQQLRRFLDRGGGWVAIHAATWTKPIPDPCVAALTGVGGFTRFRHGPVNVEITAPDHPICRGLPRQFVWKDETYWPPVPPIDAARTTVLATSQENIQKDKLATTAQPLFWTFTTGRGRSFGCVPGHFTWTFDDPWFRLLLLRGIAWAAGEPPYRFDSLALRGARLAPDVR
jgi:type 1 glutamine amidotransferase